MRLVPISAPAVWSVDTTPIPISVEFQDIENYGLVDMQTRPLLAITKKQQVQLLSPVPKKSVAERIYLIVKLLNICYLFLVMAVVVVIGLAHYPIYSIGILVILSILLSHFVSLNIKGFYRDERQAESEEAVRKQQMAHLSLIKADTMLYLSALIRKDLKKGSMCEEEDPPLYIAS